MAIAAKTKDLNGNIYGPYGDNKTDLNIDFQEMRFIIDGDVAHLHFWLTDDESGVKPYCKKGVTPQVFPEFPGHFYYRLDSDTKEMGVKCLFKVLKSLDAGKCYKGKLMCDGALGMAQQLYDSDELLKSMQALFFMGEEIEAANLVDDLVKVHAGFGGGKKFKTPMERFEEKLQVFSDFTGDADKTAAFEVSLSDFLGKAPTPEQKISMVAALL